MNFGFRNEEFLINLRENLKKFQGILDLTVGGMIWEQIIKNSATDCNLDVIWNPESHKRGWDINIEGKKTSVKSGLEKKNDFRFSGYRTTSHPLISDKIEMMEADKSMFDCYLYLSKNKNNNKVKYTLWTFLSNFCDFTKFQWDETDKYWTSNLIDGIYLQIKKKMSDQVWFFITKNKMTNMSRRLFSWTVNDEDMGKTHKIIER